MDKTRRNELVELLMRRYRQPERVVLLTRLGVDPEECTLGAQAPEEVALRIVRWFEDRGRLEELDRAARVGWSRRLVRRLSLASVATALVVLVLLFGIDLFGLQRRLCQLPLGQPALADACGAWRLGGAPTRGERLAWQSREPGSCAALRTHLTNFPAGAYSTIAHARLASRQLIQEESWTPRENPLELFVDRDAPPAPDQAAAQAVAQARATTEAQRLCQSFTATGQNRLRAARLQTTTMSCSSLKNGTVCNLRGQALCVLDERGHHEQETCAESSAPPPKN